MTFTLVHMTTSRLLVTAASASVLAWSLGIAVGHALSTDVTPDQGATVYHQECTEVAQWPAAAAQWQDLVSQGWTNPRSGDVTLLVQPGCADAWS